jgi:hypothetical protein
VGCALLRARDAPIRAFQPVQNPGIPSPSRHLRAAARLKPRHFLSFGAPNLFQNVIILPQIETIEKDFRPGGTLNGLSLIASVLVVFQRDRSRS